MNMNLGTRGCTVMGWMMPPHLDSVNVASFGKKIFAYVLKDLELRSSWITWVDLKSNDKCAYNKQKRRREWYYDSQAPFRLPSHWPRAAAWPSWCSWQVMMSSLHKWLQVGKITKWQKHPQTVLLLLKSIPKDVLTKSWNISCKWEPVRKFSLFHPSFEPSNTF